MNEEDRKYVEALHNYAELLHERLKHHSEWLTELEKENDQRYKNMRWMINYLAFFAFITFVMICFK